MVSTNVAGDASNSNKKKTRGKQRIPEFKKIEDPNSRQVTFSKRRTGLFKKAAEICVLTGAQIAVVVTSPGGRVYAFRHPNTDILFDRFLNNNNNAAAITTGAEQGAAKNVPPPPLPLINEFNQHYSAVSRELEAEKKRRDTIPVISGWYDEPVDGMNVEELQGYLCSLGELKNKVLTRADELMMINKSSAFFGSNNAFENGWNDKNGVIQRPESISTNAAVDGGFDLHYGQDFGIFQ